MDSPDPSDITFPATGSRLLSESPLLPSTSSSHTGPGGDDLSISELSLSDRTEIFRQPFSLLARREAEPSTPTRDQEEGGDDDWEDENEGKELQESEEVEKNKRLAAKLREEKLQSDIFILKKLNASFALFNEALENTGSANERVAAQLKQTDALLNKYVSILHKSEEFSRLIFDEQWQGAEADEETIERERIEAEEKARREEEERALAALREQERLKREEQERIEREEKERIERERKERASIRGGVRGVRATRASMRGVRGTTRAVPSGANIRGRSLSTNMAHTNSGEVSTQRHASSGMSGSSTRGISRRS